jgi:hypothetical protein
MPTCWFVLKDEEIRFCLTSKRGKDTFDKDWIPLKEIFSRLTPDQPIIPGSLLVFLKAGPCSTEAGTAATARNHIFSVSRPSMTWYHLIYTTKYCLINLKYYIFTDPCWRRLQWMRFY